MTARLGLAYAGVRHAFTTRNRARAGAVGRACSWSTARSRCSTAPGCSRRWAGRAATAAGLQDRVRPALRVLQPARSRPWSARCSTAWPTPSSTRFVQRAEQVHGAALTHALRVEVVYCPAPRRGRPRRHCDLPDGATRGRRAARQRRAAAPRPAPRRR
ncbi:MAG: hypothetical protein MZW92_75105 [Comamonadaceae bacterium]|nr:hypothetical protein [Comamonadaceae bacterium]